MMESSALVVIRPPKLCSQIPSGVRMANTPAIAQAAINAVLSKQGATLMNYYMSESDGFAPAANTIHAYTGITKNHLSSVRKELIEKGFITFDRSANEITINWGYIIELGKVALMLADCDGCNVKATLRDGTVEPISNRTIGELMKEYHDDDALDGVPKFTHPDYTMRGGKQLEKLTEREFQRWLKTGCTEHTDLPAHPGYVEPERCGSSSNSSRREPVKYLDVQPDRIDDYRKDGEFFISGLTKDEYDSWVAAGVSFYER